MAHAAPNPPSEVPLITDFRARLEAYVRGRGLGDDADDVVQDILARAHQASGSHDPGRSVESWLFAIARNAVVDWYRRRATKRRLHDAAVMESDVHLGSSEWDDASLLHDLAACLEPLIDALDPKYAQALRRCDFGGEPQREVARDLNLSVSAIKSRVQRGRALLLAELLSCCEVTRSATGAPLHVQPRQSENRECRRCGFGGSK